MAALPNEGIPQPHHQASERQPISVRKLKGGKFYFCLGLLVGAVGLGAILLLLLKMPIFASKPKTASALVNIAKMSPTILYGHRQSGQSSDSDFETFKRTQAALVKSRLVLVTALRDPRISSLKTLQEQIDPVQWLEKNLQTDYTTGPEILKVSLSGDRPDDLVAIVNAVTKAYLKEIVNKEHDERRARLDRLKDLFEKYDDRTQSKRKSLREMAEAAGSGDAKNLAVMERIALDQLAAYQRELRRVQLAQLDTKARIRCHGPTQIPTAPAFLLTTHHPLGLISQIPVVQALLLGRKEGATIRKLREEMKFLNIKENLLAEEVQRLDRLTRPLNHNTLDLEQLRDEIEEGQQTLRKIMSEMKILEIEKNAPSRVTLMDEAVVYQ